MFPKPMLRDTELLSASLGHTCDCGEVVSGVPYLSSCISNFLEFLYKIVNFDWVDDQAKVNKLN